MKNRNSITVLRYSMSLETVDVTTVSPILFVTKPPTRILFQSLRKSHFLYKLNPYFGLSMVNQPPCTDESVCLFGHHSVYQHYFALNLQSDLLLIPLLFSSTLTPPSTLQYTLPKIPVLTTENTEVEGTTNRSSSLNSPPHTN